MSWKYTELLNECIRILLTIALGSLLGYGKVFVADAFIPQAVKFVFYVALPLLVIRGLGIGTDFYDDKFQWSYIGVFFILRAIALVAAVVWVLLLPRDGRHGIGHVAIIWLSLTWISTIILGIPISSAVLNNPAKGTFYGLVRSKGDLESEPIYCLLTQPSTSSLLSWPQYLPSSFSCRFFSCSSNATRLSKTNLRRRALWSRSTSRHLLMLD